ncbi:metabolite traffic protein EboE [Akkermansiaceae bacterium]|nr:metabolite traffic protein EboE [Akkermansiaceae bacterium]
MKPNPHHDLAYCTNIHPAESWEETFTVLKNDVLAVRDRVSPNAPFAIGLRLSARAAEELIGPDGVNLRLFKAWLFEENCYVFTINGFPYGSFHGERVKEKVYQPDWSTEARLTYTNNLFIIIAELCSEESGGSVSTLPGSFKEFGADENLIFANLYACARFIETMGAESGKDLHLGLEPEPLGHFENTEETLEFFGRFFKWCEARELRTDCVTRHIGINYDTCHFALEFEDCHASLKALTDAGLRISKIHLSNALSFDPQNAEALKAIRQFDEPTYLHQIILNTEPLTRFKDLPDFDGKTSAREGRIHFHVPLYSELLAPLGSTLDHAEAALSFLKEFPETCPHLEIETYTWGVLPDHLQKPLTDQIAAEYEWVLPQL